jgi:hypothetical protein
MVHDIGEWLEGLGLSRYADAFTDHEIDLDALPYINEEDLKEMGVALGAVLRMRDPINNPLEPRPNAANSRSCSWIWSDQRRFPPNSIPKTSAR